MKEKRDLSGVFYRFKNPESDKWENWVFEDLPEEEQNKITDAYSREQLVSLIGHLAGTINRIGDTLNLGVKYSEDEDIGVG